MEGTGWNESECDKLFRKKKMATRRQAQKNDLNNQQEIWQYWMER